MGSAIRHKALIAFSAPIFKTGPTVLTDLKQSNVTNISSLRFITELNLLSDKHGLRTRLLRLSCVHPSIFPYYEAQPLEKVFHEVFQIGYLVGLVGSNSQRLEST